MLALLWASLGALNVPVATAAPAPPSVLTSFLPVYALTRSIAGDRLPVENWLPPGIDPHEFQFQPRDLRRLRACGLLVTAGLGLEGWDVVRLRDSASNPALRIAEAFAGLPESRLIRSSPPASTDTDHHHPGSGRDINPHCWLDPTLAAHAATNILEALSALDPEGRDEYTRRAAETVARLGALDQEFASALEAVRDIPFVTYHNAFPYLARRYGLRLVGVVEDNAAEEPTPRELARLNALIREAGVRVIFIDGPPSRLARTLASDLGLTLEPLETLETGAFRVDAYEAGMRRNLRSLVRALRRAESTHAR